MSRESLARTQRLLSIRELQRSAVQASLARAEQHAREAERLAREASSRLEETAERALTSSVSDIEQLIEARGAYAHGRLQLEVATSASARAEGERKALRDRLGQADMAVRQAERLSELAAEQRQALDARVERALNDEIAAKRVVR